MVVVETWMTKRCIADYTNTSLQGFAYFVPHPSFKRPLIEGKKSNLFYFLSSSLHPPSAIWICQCWFVNFFLSRALCRRYVSSKVATSFIEDIKIVAGFGGVRQYVIFMYKVKSKIRFDILLGQGLWKTLQWCFPF